MNFVIKNKCPNCKTIMEVREHRIITPKMLKQSYYFSEWCVCKNCKRVQHYEDKKVWN